MLNRYDIGSSQPQPIRKVLAAYTDILHTLKMGERLDNLAYKFYQDPSLAWVIMCANPEWESEFEIPFGTEIRIPYPLNRVLSNWKMDNEI